MLKKKKVRAGVLLYALVMAGIFSLLLQFYLNRQVAHHQDYVLNKEKLVAYAMAKRTYEKASSESGQQSFNAGKATYRNDQKGFTAIVDTGKNQFEFRFSSSFVWVLFGICSLICLYCLNCNAMDFIRLQDALSMLQR